MNKSQEIKKNAELLGISIEEATQMWEDDHSADVLPEVAAIEERVKDGGRHYERSAPSNKKSNRVRKVDTEKLDIMNVILEALKAAGYTDAEIEKELYIHMCGGEYSLKLTRHRKVQ